MILIEVKEKVKKFTRGNKSKMLNSIEFDNYFYFIR